ncbi:SRPBCC family protein [Sphingobacterium hungaricum]
MAQQQQITVEATVQAPVAKVWDAYNNEKDIIQWNAVHESWHCPSSENDLRVGGKFKNRMEAKDGSFGFDFEGTYDVVELDKQINYTMPDGREVQTLFTATNDKTKIEITFDPETENDPEFQKQGWQAILDNFVNYVESQKS